MVSHQYKLLIIILFASAISISCVSLLLSSAKAQGQQAFSAVLSGKNEVPPTKPNSAGLAIFQLNDNASQISFSVNISGIKNVNQAQLHIGTIGREGDVAVTLAEEKSASGDKDPPMILISGNLIKDDLQGPLKDNKISDLVNLMNNGTTYVNIYTDKYPKGEIRGQINFADIQAGGGLSSSGKETGTSGSSPSAGAIAPGPGAGGASGGGGGSGTVSVPARGTSGTIGNSSTNSSSMSPTTGSGGN